MLRRISLFLLCAFFMVAGANHFLNPAPYVAIMPPYLPYHSLLNAISGAAEIAGGIGVAFAPTRRAAGWGLIALLVAVFPANVEMLRQGGLPNLPLPTWLLWGRLPLQIVLIGWVGNVCLRSDPKAASYSVSSTM